MKQTMINAGKYNKKIEIYKAQVQEDSQGFQSTNDRLVLAPYAHVRTTKGFTLIKNDTDFEKALTNFTIRYPRDIELDRNMIIKFKGRTYTIQYLNNINEADIELEIEAKLVER